MPVRSLRRWASTTTASDLLLMAVVAFPTFMDAGWNQQGTREADWITFTLAGVSVLALLWRRRWPLAVSLACGSVLTAWYVMDHHGELLNLPTMIGLYTVAVQGTRHRTLVVGAVASAWSGGLAYAEGSTVGSPVLEMLWPLVPLALGEAVRARHELLAEHAARAAEAEVEREREARHRVEAERVRIAREFHDVVAHTMAAVNVQMGVAVAAFDTRPDTAREALAQARASSKQALHELRATIALLRDPTATDAPTPAPRLTQVHELAEPARAAGIAVTIHDGAAGHELPAAVELAAYRIVQEALTNVVRHARAQRAAVSLTHDHAELVVEITDDGIGGEPSPPGHGLIGMRERAAALGGRLEHGPCPGGGFRVRAVLPTGPATGMALPPQATGPATGTGLPTQADSP